MTNSNPQISTTNNPVVKVGNMFRSIYLPGHNTDAELTDILQEDLAAYGLAAVRIVEHGGANGGHGVYWEGGQILHLEDGTVVAHSLAEAAQPVKHLGWSNGSWIRWEAIRNVQPSLLQASK
ncbi:hypothetical protein H7347_10365 [Corynebacterium sp. zg-331]|uniref:hypothetical protein n=1 Tax=unclassified Corynebacterium TaxID=2624378 RepID=UPI00128E7972|nr:MULTISPECIES: hypothetical protein [unclassified Corynebacterium]MBC3186960.1 hypothetical protein [Corynebacterium sp. zg-331]MPV53437.1 hypothetical protein [Corynebacterium sp. zg331]